MNVYKKKITVFNILNSIFKKFQTPTILYLES